MSAIQQPDSLEALLHRCRRAELEPLATALALQPAKLGLGDLARATARQLRRAAAHPIGNAALRSGEGPPYDALIEALADRHGVTARATADREFELTRRRLAQKPSAQEANHPTAFWRHPAQIRPPALLAGLWVASPLGCLIRPLLFPLLPVVVWYALRPDESRTLDLIVEVARLRERLRHRVTIGVVGSPSSGKDSAIRALFGIDTGNISPIAGSTKTVAIHPVENAPHLFVVNTPGLGDVDAAVHEESRQILDHIDIYLYLVNAEGGVQAREQSDYARCVATGKPVLAIVNKIDVLRPRDRERFLDDCRTKLGAPLDAFVATAFDPLPELSETPLHVEAVHGWVAARLTALGRDADDLPPLPARAGMG